MTKGKVSPTKTSVDCSCGHYTQTISRTYFKVLDTGKQKREATTDHTAKSRSFSNNFSPFYEILLMSYLRGLKTLKDRLGDMIPISE